MVSFAKIVNQRRPLTNFAKRFVLAVWKDSEYAASFARFLKCVWPFWENMRSRVKDCHCEKSVGIRRFSGLYFPAFGIPSISPYSGRMWENSCQKNSEYWRFSRSVPNFLVQTAMAAFWKIYLYMCRFSYCANLWNKIIFITKYCTKY